MDYFKPMVGTLRTKTAAKGKGLISKIKIKITPIFLSKNIDVFIIIRIDN